MVARAAVPVGVDDGAAGGVLRALALGAEPPVWPNGQNAVTSALLGNQPLLADLAAGTTVKVPLRGTLSHPEIDREILARHLKELGKTLLRRGAMRGAAELFIRRSRAREESKPKP